MEYRVWKRFGLHLDLDLDLDFVVIVVVVVVVVVMVPNGLNGLEPVYRDRPMSWRRQWNQHPQLHFP